MFGSGNWGVLG